MNDNFKMPLIVIAGIIGIFGLIWVLVDNAIKEQEAWVAFKNAHACKVVGDKQGYSRTTIISTYVDGKMIMTPYTQVVPGERAWLCDDGVTYWRTK